MGTFGGPQSYIVDAGIPGGKFLNSRGVFTGFADSSAPDPFPNFCFNADCFVSPAFQWQNGVMTDLRALHKGVSSASAWISANGPIAGFSQAGFGADASANQHPFLLIPCDEIIRVEGCDWRMVDTAEADLQRPM
jgi:hypothetical protein